jgi:GrpB-like predicted nucleotidyltransferase (UPF0157 family)
MYLERIEQYKKLGLGLKRSPEVILADHNPKWVEAFQTEKSFLLDSMKMESFFLVHCGSTSIPGIFAKPIIDILGGVDSLQELDAKSTVLESLGYEFKGEYGIPGRRYCTLYSEDKVTTYVHLHIFEKTHYEFYKHLVFAHYLRSSKKASSEYEQLKLKLVREKKLIRSDYSAAKNEVILKLQAEAEAQWPFGTDLSLLGAK